MRFLDANVVIYHLIKDRKFGEISSKIIGRIDAGEKVFFPVAALKEVVFFLRRNNYSMDFVIDLVSSFSKDNIKIVGDDYNLFLYGLKISKKFSVPITDGIIIAIMKQQNIGEIYTNDGHFERAGMKIVFE